MVGHVPPSTRLDPVAPSRATELLYLDRLSPIVRDLRGVGETITSKLHKSFIGRDAYVFDAGERRPPKATVDEARRAYGAVNGAPTATIVVNANANAVDATIAIRVHRAIGVDVSAFLADRKDIAHEMAAARRANVELITSIPDRYFDLIEDAIDKHWAEGVRWETLADRIQEIGNVTARRAALIAQDQTSKMNAAFNAVRQPSLGIRRYEWSTAHDERVRPTHRLMDGTVNYWGAPPLVGGEHLHPGEDVRCRCAALPVIDYERSAGAGRLAPEEYTEAA